MTDQSESGGAGRRVPVLRAVTVAVILVLVGVVAWLAWGYFSGESDGDAADTIGALDEESGMATGPAAPAVAAARSGAEEMFGYGHVDAEEQFDQAADRMTDEFSDEFLAYTSENVLPKAKEMGLSVGATVAGAAPVRYTGDSADVLVFLDQAARSEEGSDPAFTPSRMIVSVEKSGDRWLVADVDVL